MNEDFDRLNRLRKVAGQKPLKVWKGSADQLDAQIRRLTDEGYEDPGPETKPPVDFGKDAKADTPPTAKEIPALKTGPAFDPANQDKLHKMPAKLARGTDTESHCKKAVQDLRAKEKPEKKGAKKATLKDNKDGTITKTTTAGKKRKLSKEVSEKIRKQREAKGKSGDTFSLADLARDLSIDPKVARAKIRRNSDKAEKLKVKGEEGWVFPNNARKALTDILQPKG